MFARVFRKHLEGGIVKSIRQIGNDRRVEIDIESKDEIGDTIYRTVILEIMGKHSNLILVDDQYKIIEGFKHLTPNTNQYRTVMLVSNMKLLLLKTNEIHMIFQVMRCSNSLTLMPEKLLNNYSMHLKALVL